MFDYKKIKWIHLAVLLLVLLVLWQLTSWIMHLSRPGLNVTFKLLWGTKHTEDTANFSIKNDQLPHTGNILLVVHDDKFKLFELNKFASQGVAQSAMFGNNDLLIEQIKKLGYRYHTHSVINGGESASFNIKFDKSNPYVSVIAMMAPSSNWFISSEPIDLRKHEKINPLLAYNAGVDWGDDWKTFPKQTKKDISPISLITSGVLFPPRKTDDNQQRWTFIASKESAKQYQDLYDTVQPVAVLLVSK
jgi:hypothetical protein